MPSREATRKGEAFRVVLTLPRHCSRRDADELAEDVELQIQPHSIHVEGPARTDVERFVQLQNDARHALEALNAFWTKSYGPNEALTDAFDSLDAMDAEWNSGDDAPADADRPPGTSGSWGEA